MGVSKLLDSVSQKTSQSDTVVISELTPWELEDLMDWMENQGCTILQLCQDIEGITVRFLRPPGFQLPGANRSSRERQIPLVQVAGEWGHTRGWSSCAINPL
jgi:hypothetical protein